MAKEKLFHDDLSRLPATGLRARQLGETLYFTGAKCNNGHLSPRYASSSNCVQCIADKRGMLEIKSRKKRFSQASEENKNRAKEAIANGLSRYESASSCPSGHLVRFVTNHNCVECSKTQTQKRKENAKWGRIKKKYSMTKIEVLAMLENQKNKCLICECDVSSKYHIDHCHSTSRVRGILCSRCNQAIGLLDEDKVRMQRAIDYISAGTQKC